MAQNFIYSGQYKSQEGLNGSFQDYWSTYGRDIKDDNIRLVVEGIYNILYNDVETNIKTNDYNQKIFDQLQFNEICKVVSAILEKYININSSETKTTTDVVKQRIINKINDEVISYLNNVDIKQLVNQQVLSQKIHKLLVNFFKSIIDTTQSGVDKMIQKLKNSYNIGSNIKIFKYVKETKDYKQFIQKIGDVISNKQYIKEPNKEKTESKSTVTLPSNTKSKIIRNIFRLVDKKTVPIINSFLIQYNKRIVTSNKDSEYWNFKHFFKKHTDKIRSGLKKLGGILTNVVTAVVVLPFKIMKTIVSISKKILKFVLSPLKILSKIITSNWFTNILTLSFFSSATMFQFGMLSAFIWKFISEDVVGAVHTFIDKSLGQISNLLDKFGIQDLISGIKNIFSNLKPIVVSFISLVNMLLNPINGITGFGQTIFGNLLLLAGVGVTTIKNIFDWIPTIVATFKKFMSSTILKGLYTGGGLIGKIVAITISYLSVALSKLYSSDEEGNMKFSDAVSSKFRNKNKIQRSLRANYDIYGGNEDALKNMEKNIDLLDDEIHKVSELSYKLEHIEEYKDEENIPSGIQNEFVQSGLYNPDELEMLLNNISKSIGGVEFELLTSDNKIIALRKLLESRMRKTNQIYSLYEKGTKDQVREADDIMLKIDVEGIETGYNEQRDIGEAYLSQEIDIKARKTVNDEYGAIAGAAADFVGVDEAMMIGQSKLKFDTAEDMEKTMDQLQKGIELNSELGQFLKSHQGDMGVIITTSELFGNDFVHIQDNYEGRQLLFKYLKQKATKNRDIKTEMLASFKTAYSQTMIADGGTIYKPTPEQTEVMEDIVAEVQKIVETNADDKSKLYKINTILNKKKIEGELVEQIMDKLYERAGIDDYIVVTKPSKQIDDISGDNKSREQRQELLNLEENQQVDINTFMNIRR